MYICGVCLTTYESHSTISILKQEREVGSGEIGFFENKLKEIQRKQVNKNF
jgi:hypothetical protein